MSETGLGPTDTETAAGWLTRVNDASDDLVGSATDVALTVTDCCTVIDGGAVYKPVLEIVPTAGLSDQATPVLVVEATWTENCWLWDTPKTTWPGLRYTFTLPVLLPIGMSDEAARQGIAKRTSEIYLVTLREVNGRMLSPIA